MANNNAPISEEVVAAITAAVEMISCIETEENVSFRV